MASLDIKRLGLGAMALIGASLVFKGVKGKEISKKEEDNLALEIGIDSVMGAEGDPHDAKNFDKWCHSCGSYDKNPTLPEGYCDECICVSCNETSSSGPSYAYCEVCYEETYPNEGKDYDRSGYYAESFGAEYDEIINQLMDSSFITMDYNDKDIEYAKEDLIENIESGFIVPVEKLKQRLKNAGFKKAKTVNEGDYGTFHTYEPIELDGEMLTMQLVETSLGGGMRMEFIPSGYGLLGSYISTYDTTGDMTISELNKKMDKIEPLMRKIGLLKKGDTIKREHDYSESENYCEYKFPSLVGLSDKELDISMIEWDEEKGDLLLTLELNDGIDKKYAYISTPLKRDDFVSHKNAESFEVETSSKGFLKENLPDSKEEMLKDLKEDLEYRKRVLSQFKKLEASLMPFTTGMVRHLPKMEDKMLEFLYYAKQNMKHYTKLVAETQEQMQQIKGAESFEAEA